MKKDNRPKPKAALHGPTGLRKYYAYVGVPILLVALGVVVFWSAIASTVNGNPHPQINYLIFVLIAVGCVLMMHAIHGLNREAEAIEQYAALIARHDEPAAVRQFLARSRVLSTDLLRLVEAGRHGSVSSVEHALIEGEIERLIQRQQARFVLPQYLSGMMVGLGLLGTFIGLLGALAEIGKLIGAFSVIDASDPTAAVSNLIARLTEPMRAMGVAFSASLFGVLGSLIMGMLFVGVRRAASDFFALVRSRVTQVCHDPDAHDDGLPASLASDARQLSGALGELAQHSPVLAALATALDQSERRVRELVSGLAPLVAGIEVLRDRQDQALQAWRDESPTRLGASQALQSIEAHLQQVRADASRMAEAQQEQARRQSTVEFRQAEAHADQKDRLDAIAQLLRQQLDRALQGEQRLAALGASVDNGLDPLREGVDLLRGASDSLRAMQAQFAARAHADGRAQALVESHSLLTGHVAGQLESFAERQQLHLERFEEWCARRAVADEQALIELRALSQGFATLSTAIDEQGEALRRSGDNLALAVQGSRERFDDRVAQLASEWRQQTSRVVEEMNARNEQVSHTLVKAIAHSNPAAARTADRDEANA